MRPTRVAAVAAAASLATDLVGFLVGRSIESPADAAARARAPLPSPITVEVEKRRLSANLVLRGTIGATDATEITLPATQIGTQGTVVVRAPAKGDSVAEGQAPLVVADRPVFVLQGDLPMYRDLRPGAKGEDVKVLQAALQRLGLDPGAIDGDYSNGTEEAVRRLYAAQGFEPVGPTAEEQTRLADLRQQASAARAKGDAATANTADEQLAALESTTGVSVPANEIVFVPATPVIVQAVAVTRGAKAEGPLMTLATTSTEIRSSVARADRTLVKPGMTAKVEVTDLNTTLTASVASIADQPGTEGAGQDRYALSLAPEEVPDDAYGQGVRITLPVRSTDGEVLVVPAAALSVDSDGDSRVEVLANPDSDRSITVKVTTGLQANGVVEVTPAKDGPQLEVGDLVVVGRQNGDA